MTLAGDYNVEEDVYQPEITAGTGDFDGVRGEVTWALNPAKDKQLYSVCLEAAPAPGTGAVGAAEGGGPEPQAPPPSAAHALAQGLLPAAAVVLGCAWTLY